jgi:hypothetical protein
MTTGLPGDSITRGYRFPQRRNSRGWISGIFRRRQIVGLEGGTSFVLGKWTETGIRLMEKDNKKARDDAKREYNDAIRVSG